MTLPVTFDTCGQFPHSRSGSNIWATGLRCSPSSSPDLTPALTQQLPCSQAPSPTRFLIYFHFHLIYAAAARICSFASVPSAVHCAGCHRAWTLQRAIRGDPTPTRSARTNFSTGSHTPTPPPRTTSAYPFPLHNHDLIWSPKDPKRSRDRIDDCRMLAWTPAASIRSRQLQAPASSC